MIFSIKNNVVQNDNVMNQGRMQELNSYGVM